MRSTNELYDILKANKYFDYFAIKKKYLFQNSSKEEVLKINEKEKEYLNGYMDKYQNPFMHILHFEPKYFDYFKINDRIIIQEKIDGANTHININADGVNIFGSNYILNERNHTQGFWYWVNDNVHKISEKYFNLDIYGEWLVPHHCDYPSEKYGEFYVFDVMENGIYWSQDKVEAFTKEVGFQYAPKLYDGPFINWKHIMSFVGKTKLGGIKGEGVVVKNQTKLNRTDGCFYVKIVDVEFQETNNARKHIKTVNMDEVIKLEEQSILAKSIVTLARVRKIILKMIDNNEIDINWFKFNEKDVTNTIKKVIYEDCLKEESETVNKIGKNFRKLLSENTINHIKILKEELK